MRLSDFHQDFNRNFKKIGGLLGSLTEDLTGSLDQKQVRRILSSALDLLRPYHAVIGMRVRKLTRSQVEATIPNRTHNRNSQGFIEEGVVISAGQQMLKLLIARWEIPVDYELEEIRFDRLQDMRGILTARLEWEDLSREALRAELMREPSCLHDFYIHFFDAEEKRVADLHLNLKVRMPVRLESKSRQKRGSHGDHCKRS